MSAEKRVKRTKNDGKLLTDNTVKNAKPAIKADGTLTINRIKDEKGMYLFITASGHKYFRMDYRFARTRKTLSLGVYPETSLKVARERRDEARKLLQNDIDPSAAKKAKKLGLVEEHNNTFRYIAQEWFKKRKSAWSELHAIRKWQLLEKNVLPMPKQKNRATIIIPKEIGGLLRAIDIYNGDTVTRAALN